MFSIHVRFVYSPARTRLRLHIVCAHAPKPGSINWCVKICAIPRLTMIAKQIRVSHINACVVLCETKRPRDVCGISMVSHIIPFVLTTGRRRRLSTVYTFFLFPHVFEPRKPVANGSYIGCRGLYFVTLPPFPSVCKFVMMFSTVSFKDSVSPRRKPCLHFQNPGYGPGTVVRKSCGRDRSKRRKGTKIPASQFVRYWKRGRIYLMSSLST